MARIRADYVFGKTDTALTDTATTLSSPALARLPAVADPDVAAVTLHDAATGVYEIVHVTAHTAAATTATILRAQEGSTARAWVSGATWLHGITVLDLSEALTIDSDRNTNAAGTGTIILKGDTNKERVEIISVGASPSPQFQGWGGGGTTEAPTTTLNNQRLFALSGSGFDATNTKILSARALMLFVSAEQFTATAQGSRIQFSVVAKGTTELVERMRLDHDGKLGIGQTVPNSRLHTDGAIATPVRAVTATTTLTENDSILTADATTATVTVNLPTAVGITGRRYTIKKVDASVNAVTVDPSGTETIDGAATSALTSQWAGVSLVSDGANWLKV